MLFITKVSIHNRPMSFIILNACGMLALTMKINPNNIMRYLYLITSRPTTDAALNMSFLQDFQRWLVRPSKF